MGGPGSGRRKEVPVAVPEPESSGLMTTQRTLDEKECALFTRVVKRTGHKRPGDKMKDVTAGYMKRGDMTQCVLMKDKFALFTGQAYKSPKDPKDHEAAKSLAFARAVTNMMNSTRRKVNKEPDSCPSNFDPR